MKFLLKFVFAISSIFSPLLLSAQNSAISIPDSLTKGVLIKVWEVTDPAIKSVEKPALGKLIGVFKDDQAGLADWKGNTQLLPRSKPYFVEMTGYILIKETKSYVFNMQGYDGCKLYIDGNMLADNDGLHKDFLEKHAEMYLTAGLHPFKIVAFNNKHPKGREVSLAWNTEGETFRWVPAELLYASKKKLSTAKINSYESGNPEDVASDNVKGYSNAIHPSFDLFTLHDATITPKVGGIDFLSNGKLAVCTWDSLGQVFLFENVFQGDPNKVKYKRIAWGLAEPLGLKVVDDKIYVLQKQELTQLVDNNGDEIIDEYRTICNAWGATGNFHEFAFGLVYKDGYFYATLATAIQPGGKSTIPQNKDRGKAIRIGLDGSYEVIASGLRTPNGIGIGVDNEIFIADNQGDWLPSCKILHLSKGAFFGNYSVELYSVGKLDEKPPVVWLPQNEIGNSATQPTILKDGPYAGQMAHGDVTHGGLKRVFVEKVNGEYQGVVFPFMQGLEGGTNRLVWGPDGALYIGCVGSTGNWGQFRKKQWGLQKIKFNGKPTFDLLAIRAKNNGFELEFTEPVSDKFGLNPADIKAMTWRYEPTMQYGGPKIDLTELEILSITPSSDRKKFFVELNGLIERNVVYFELNSTLTSKTGNTIWTNKGWYTLNSIPTEKGQATAPKFKKPVAANAPAPASTAKNAAATSSKTTGAAAPAVKELSDQEIMALGPKLVDNAGCLACHSMNEKVLGPSFKMIRAKYNNDPATVNKLIDKVYKGGSGVWGDQAMPSNNHVSKDEIKKMVRYILNLQK